MKKCVVCQNWLAIFKSVVFVWEKLFVKITNKLFVQMHFLRILKHSKTWNIYNKNILICKFTFGFVLKYKLNLVKKKNIMYSWHMCTLYVMTKFTFCLLNKYGEKKYQNKLLKLNTFVERYEYTRIVNTYLIFQNCGTAVSLVFEEHHPFFHAL